MYPSHSKVFPNILRIFTFIAHVVQFYFCYTKICSESPGQNASFTLILVLCGIFTVLNFLALIDTIFFVREDDGGIDRYHFIDILMAWLLLIFLIPYVPIVISIRKTHEDALSAFSFFVAYLVLVFEIGFPVSAHTLWRRWTDILHDEDEDFVPAIACTLCYPCFVVGCAFPSALALVGNPFHFLAFLIQKLWQKIKEIRRINEERKEKEQIVKQYA